MYHSMQLLLKHLPNMIPFVMLALDRSCHMAKQCPASSYNLAMLNIEYDTGTKIKFLFTVFCAVLS